MKIGLVVLSQLKSLDSEGSNGMEQKQNYLCDRILYGCKETLFNQLV
ncbi:hypothetical protein [Nostoc sp. 'Peltigera membranacea cyanobiont' 210A]|nr:hypothetical protein [Nostoc sp. 'Peltigera membranacea cyanobiont' 210A]